MSFEVPPKSSRLVPVTDSHSFEIDRRHIVALIDNMKPMYQNVRVFNKTKTCQVKILFDGAGTVIIEVTNEKEDSKFMLESTEATESQPENQPKNDIETNQ